MLNPATVSAVMAWAVAVATRAVIVVATSAAFLAVATSRFETLACVWLMSAMRDARSEELAVTVVWRLIHESLR